MNSSLSPSPNFPTAEDLRQLACETNQTAQRLVPGLLEVIKDQICEAAHDFGRASCNVMYEDLQEHMHGYHGEIEPVLQLLMDYLTDPGRGYKVRLTGTALNISWTNKQETLQ
jgi:hypothetical protein